MMISKDARWGFDPPWKDSEGNINIATIPVWTTLAPLSAFINSPLLTLLSIVVGGGCAIYAFKGWNAVGMAIFFSYIGMLAVDMSIKQNPTAIRLF
jgi:hypothetical protein